MIIEQIYSCPFDGAVKRLYLEGKVLELRPVDIRGMEQWIYIRGEDRDRPEGCTIPVMKSQSISGR